MSFERQKRLVERLLEKSRAGQIAWEESPEEDVFQVSFARNRVQISTIKSVGFQPNHKIRIADEYDNTTESFFDYNLDSVGGVTSSKWKDQMYELHALARRKAMKADEILDIILSEIG